MGKYAEGEIMTDAKRAEGLLNCIHSANSDRETALAYLASIGYEAIRGRCATPEEALTMLVERFADIREEARREALEEAVATCHVAAKVHDRCCDPISVSAALTDASRIRSLMDKEKP